MDRTVGQIGILSPDPTFNLSSLAILFIHTGFRNICVLIAKEILLQAVVQDDRIVQKGDAAGNCVQIPFVHPL